MELSKIFQGIVWKDIHMNAPPDYHKWNKLHIKGAVHKEILTMVFSSYPFKPIFIQKLILFQRRHFLSDNVPCSYTSFSPVHSNLSTVKYFGYSVKGKQISSHKNNIYD